MELVAHLDCFEEGSQLLFDQLRLFERSEVTSTVGDRIVDKIFGHFIGEIAGQIRVDFTRVQCVAKFDLFGNFRTGKKIRYLFRHRSQQTRKKINLRSESLRENVRNGFFVQSCRIAGIVVDPVDEHIGKQFVQSELFR